MIWAYLAGVATALILIAALGVLFMDRHDIPWPVWILLAGATVGLAVVMAVYDFIQRRLPRRQPP